MAAGEGGPGPPGATLSNTYPKRLSFKSDVRTCNLCHTVTNLKVQSTTERQGIGQRLLMVTRCQDGPSRI